MPDVTDIINVTNLPTWAVALGLVLNFIVAIWRHTSTTTNKIIDSSAESRHSSDSITVRALELIAENGKRSAEADNRNADTNSKVADTLAQINKHMQTTTDELGIIKDVTTSHRKEFNAAAIDQRLTMLLQANERTQTELQTLQAMHADMKWLKQAVVLIGRRLFPKALTQKTNNRL